MLKVTKLCWDCEEEDSSMEDGRCYNCSDPYANCGCDLCGGWDSIGEDDD